MSASVETVLKGIVAVSWRIFRAGQGGVPRVYGAIHNRNSNTARRGKDPRDGGEHFQNSFLQACYELNRLR